MGGRQTALIPPGQKRATTDKRIARALANDIEKELLRSQLTGIVTGRVNRVSFGDYAHEHLDTKSRLGKKLSASHMNDLERGMDRIGVLAGFPKAHVRTKPFRHTYGSMRIQTVDSGKPVAIYTVSRELGYRDTKMVEQTYGHLLNQRHRRSVVGYRRLCVSKS